MTEKYVLTVTGAISVEDAFTFFVNQVNEEYTTDTAKDVVSRGFKRALLSSPNLKLHINKRLSRLDPYSPIEFVWMGHGENDTHCYVLYGHI